MTRSFGRNTRLLGVAWIFGYYEPDFDPVSLYEGTQSTIMRWTKPPKLSFRRYWSFDGFVLRMISSEVRGFQYRPRRELRFQNKLYGTRLITSVTWQFSAGRVLETPDPKENAGLQHRTHSFNPAEIARMDLGRT